MKKRKGSIIELGFLSTITIIVNIIITLLSLTQKDRNHFVQLQFYTTRMFLVVNKKNSKFSTFPQQREVKWNEFRLYSNMLWIFLDNIREYLSKFHFVYLIRCRYVYKYMWILYKYVHVIFLFIYFRNL